MHLPQYHPDSRVERRNHQKDHVKKVIPPAGMSSQAVPTPQAGIERALATLGPAPRVAVVPQGPYVLATVRGEKRPLGHGNPL